MLSKIIAATIGFVGIASAVEVNSKEEFVKEQQKTACYVYTDMEFFKIKDLQKDTPWKHTQDGVTYSWNFCSWEPLCTAETETTLAAASSNANECDRMSG
jgi:hypothetical protein